ncbi:MAG: hypothetical protein HY291_21480 [Planctomycetes bacterium]|nr:hypothetical protein [Planctomycetota bacterium]
MRFNTVGNRGALLALALLVLQPFLLRGEEPAPAEAPKLPAGVEPLAPDMQQRIEKLKEAAQKYRGLALKNKNLAVGQKSRDALKQKVVEMFSEEMPKNVLDPMERSLKNFDLIPKDMDLGKYYPQLLSSQIGGYYDPKAKYLVLVKDGGGLLGPEMTKKLGQDVADKMEETVLVHEINHAIQDQYFDLVNFGQDKNLSDAAAAKLALVEGDATLVMYGYMLGVPMERLPGVDRSLDMVASDPVKMAQMMPEMPGSKEIAEAPAFIRDNLIFSYIQGLGFCIQVRQAGGQKLLDYCFAKDPPKSTEQILHPEKWLAKRDDPVEIALPDLAAMLGGFAKTSEGNWGEFNTRLLLTEKLGQPAREKAAAAAKGWGGDKFALYAKEGKEVLVWLTAWDTPEDANEFYDTAGQAFKQDWQMALQAVREGAGVSSVVLVRGDVPKAAFDALKEKLFALKLEAPANKALDLAALGITADDKPKMMSMAEMTQMLNDPVVKKMMLAGLGGGDASSLDVGKLLSDPKMQDMLKEMGDKMLGPGMGEQMKQAMNNPAMKKMMEDMLKDPEAMQQLMNNPLVKKMMDDMTAKQGDAPGVKQAEPAKGKADEGAWSSPGLGLSLKAPKGDGWKIDANPPASPMGPKPLVQITGPDNASIVVVEQALPMQMTLEQIAPMAEMGPQMILKNYKRVSAGYIKSGETKGYELEYTGTAEGQDGHIVQRIFLRGAKMLVVSGNASPDTWEKHSKALKESIESLGLSEPQPAKKDAPQPKVEKEDNVLKE